MNRIIYNTKTGKIVNSKFMTDRAWSRRAVHNPDESYIEGYLQQHQYELHSVNTTTGVLESVAPVVTTDEQYIRERRNKLLQLSDWTQGADSPLTDAKKAEWATYRQALRDLSTTYPFATTAKASVVWPTKPE